MSHWSKSVKQLLAIGTLVFIGSLLGSCLERAYQKHINMSAESVNTIAVVNMDEGVIVGEQQINYASQLIQMPGENYVMVGLNDAKNGIENGTYAAYVIIPENFSEAVVSIQGNPEKIILEYAFNQNLDKDTEMQAIIDVSAFEKTLNTNIAYVYVDAILAAFHQVQDDSTTILKNDIDELVQLQEVDSEQLLAQVEQPEITIAESEIEQINLTSYITQNNSILAEMEQGYVQAVQKGISEFSAIQKIHDEVSVASTEFFVLYESILNESSTKNTEVLEQGKEKVEEALGIFNQNMPTDLTTMKTKINELIESQRIADELSANQQMEAVLLSGASTDDSTINALQGTWNTAYDEWNAYVQRTSEQKGQELYQNYQTQVSSELETLVKKAYVQGAKDALSEIQGNFTTQDNTYTSEEIKTVCTNIEGSVDGNAAQYFTNPSNTIQIVLQEELLNSMKIKLDDAVDDAGNSIDKPSISGNGNSQSQSITLDRIDATSEENIETIVTNFSALFAMEDDRQIVSDVLQTELIDKLEDAHEGQMDTLAEKGSILQNAMTVYETNALNYDPFKYLDDAHMENYLSEINNNASNMLYAVEDNNIQYLRYASDVYITAREDLYTIQNIYESANVQTSNNVKECVAFLQSSREQLNAQNTDMLKNFTGLLEYTREGNQDDVEAYGHIVEPVVSIENGNELVGIDENSSEISGAQIFAIIIGVGVLMIAICIATYVRRQETLEESEEYI